MTAGGVAATLASLRPRLPSGFIPEVLIVLGSGLDGVADAVADPIDVDVADVPGLPVSTVPGHAASLRFGTLAGRPVMVQRGRVHLYSGHGPAAVTRTVDLAAALGCSTVLITNAAGGLHEGLAPGDLLVITDQLNLTGASPLTGVLRDGAPIFLDMTRAYDLAMGQALDAAAAANGVTLKRGVYAGLRGPAFETPAEVAMLRALGADVVGMSTVLEVIAARSHGMRVAGVSSVTNVHRRDQEPVTHAEVLDVGATAARVLATVVLAAVSHL